MASEQERRQAELRYLDWKRDAIKDLEIELSNWKEEYEDGLKRAKESDTPWEKLSWDKKFARRIGWSMSNAEFYEKEGPGKKLKEYIEQTQQKIDAIWQDLQKNYGITPDSPGDYTNLNKAIAEKERLVERSVPTKAERLAPKLAAQAEAVPQESPVPAPPHVRERHYRDMSGYRLPEDGSDGSEGVPPPGQPPPTPGNMPLIDHSKDDSPQRQAPEMGKAKGGSDQKASQEDTPAPQPPPTDTKPTLQHHQKIPLIDLYKDEVPEQREGHQPAQEHEPPDTQEDTHAGWQALKREAEQRTQARDPVARGDQLKEMTLEQQGKSGARKIPLRELYDLEPEPPSPPGPERDRDR